MTLGDFQNTFRPLFSRPKKDRFILVKEKGTNKTLMNDELGADTSRERNNEYSREIVTWAFKDNSTIIVCVE